MGNLSTLDRLTVGARVLCQCLLKSLVWPIDGMIEKTATHATSVAAGGPCLMFICYRHNSRFVRPYVCLSILTLKKRAQKTKYWCKRSKSQDTNFHLENVQFKMSKGQRRQTSKTLERPTKCQAAHTPIAS